MTSVAVLKGQRKQNVFILGALARGEFIEGPAIVEGSKEATIEDTGYESPAGTMPDASTPEVRALATLELLQQYAKPYMDRVTELEGKLEIERDIRLVVERDAARMSGQLESNYRQSWYQFWKPKKPGE